jgi:serine phosphatase RsbU (regulator of sigma subunit)
VLDLKRFHRKLELVFGDLDRGRPGEKLATQFIGRVLDHLGPQLGLRAAQLYHRTPERLRLARQWGEHAPNLSGTPLDQELPWVGDTVGGLTGVMVLGDPSRLAAFYSGDGGAGRIAQAELGAALSALDYALSQHLRRRQLEDLLDQARAIQISLLPPGRPEFGDFDIAAVSVPAESVGGDLYDFLFLDAETLAFAVADASGHGFPAALQARDVATGLRMGAERDLKITRTVEKLNRIIHRSGLVTRFVSLFFGELELNGNLSYINAGHPPPLLLDDRGFQELTVGGMILGPTPDALYKLGFAHVDRGAVLVAFTDGVVERARPDGEHFGVQRVQEWMEVWREGPADRAVNDLLAALKKFGGDAPFEDDVTLMFARRP